MEETGKVVLLFFGEVDRDVPAGDQVKPAGDGGGNR